MKRYDIGDNHWVGIATGHEAPDDRVVALIIDHLTPEGKPHTGSLTLRQSDSRYHTSGGKEIHLWNVLNPEPPRIWFEYQGIEHVTLHPSIQCPCGDHGFIYDGRWVLTWPKDD